MLPAYIANMAPVFAKRFGLLKFLARPVDGGREFSGRKIFGEHKTWRGFVVGIIAAIAGAWLQYFLYSVSPFREISFFNYFEVSPWFLGFIFGFGALFGDLIKSFFKRRIGIAPGKPWIPFDQLDFVLGALIFVSLIFLPPWRGILVIIIVTPILHLLANQIGFILKIKNTKW
ncbi:CDP-2,3-bis-(O-geranylgeranyl)-sn-glycerol synthase [Patescibacteria group bacterium]|nr:CDP-2,3-bis-(O-geranylgeranyl)-sn-glycerol synthase [Patescibacteria group bacterium]